MSAQTEEAVLRANDAFYEAFGARDTAAMDELWATSCEVHCVHPGWPPLSGRDAVMESWLGILEGGEAPAIRHHSPRATVFGDAAVVICLEVIPGAVLVATNAFVQERGDWRMVHHHAGPISIGTGGSGGTGGTPPETIH